MANSAYATYVRTLGRMVVASMRDAGSYWPLWRCSVLKGIHCQVLAMEAHRIATKTDQDHQNTVQISPKWVSKSMQKRWKIMKNSSLRFGCVLDGFLDAKRRKAVNLRGPFWRPFLYKNPKNAMKIRCRKRSQIPWPKKHRKLWEKVPKWWKNGCRIYVFLKFLAKGRFSSNMHRA